MVKSHMDPKSMLSMQSMQRVTLAGRNPVAAACFARSARSFRRFENRTISEIDPQEHVEHAKRTGLSKGRDGGGVAMAYHADGREPDRRLAANGGSRDG